MIRSAYPAQPGAPIAAPTLRRDPWWLEILPTVLLLGGFGIYATWRAFTNAHYYVEPYLSPFYSPCLAEICDHVTLRIVGAWWTFTPASLVLWIPLGFRTTCYYYRKAYYRAFFGQPFACAVRDLPRKYAGETRFPLVVQNVHRYFFWLSGIVLFFLWWDVVKAFDFPNGFGMGLGTLILLVSTALLSLYSVSCHSCRHIVGGSVNVFSRAPIRYRLWRIISWLNERHGAIAWVSLVLVALADLYVYLLSAGVLRDVRFF
jgi:hypothetical protein